VPNGIGCEHLKTLFEPLKLELWLPELAQQFLLKRTDKTRNQNDSEQTALQGIIEEFAGLPLALEQAGAYIKQKRINFVQYWQAYQTEKKALLEYEGLVLEHKHKPLLITLQLALEKQSEAARQLFNLCAFLNGDAIPEEIVEALIEGDYTEARNALLDYSLLEYDDENAYLRQHRLLQSLAKSFLKTEEQKTFAEAVIAQVAELFPDPLDIETWQTCQRLLISALTCDELSRHFAIENKVMAKLYNQLALYLQNYHADYKQALLFHEQAYRLYEKLLGENHPAVATSLNNLAGLYESQGCYEEAFPLYQRALAIDEKVYGKHHPDIAIDMSNLAGCYDSRGFYDEALLLYQHSLVIREQQLGESHPDTGISYGNLAGVLEAIGDYNNALIYRKKALENHENSLGKEHPITATSLNNLAALYDSQGRYEEALPLYLRSLAIDEKVYGKDHPDVATDLNNLAALYYSQGRYAEALPLYQRSLAIREKQLGENHPNVASILNNLALLYKSQGRYEAALPLYQRSLAIREQQLGENHPDVAESLNNLAALYYAQGHYEEALPLYQRALAILEKSLGAEHPLTKLVAGNYAGLLEKMSES
jgi:tetratricopeptide (TPR) repeat protein